jgi:hypothetical protein
MNSHPEANGSPDPLERELASFRPAPPSQELRERIRQVALAETGKVSRSSHQRMRQAVWASAAVLVLGASLAPFWIWPQGQVSDPVISETAAPAEVEEETVWGAGELKGIVDNGDGPRMWKVRYETVRRTAWADEHGSVQLRFEPEERLLFVPVSYN